MDDAVEEQLVERARGGDLGAFETLLERATRKATRLAFAMLQDRAEAEDAFQESALNAWRRLGNLRRGTRFEPWFIGIVANRCRYVRRERWWRLLRFPDLVVSQKADENAWIEGEDLRRAVESLPHNQRVAIVLHFHLDMPVSEVAVALGMSTAGTKSRINRALKRLRPAVRVEEVQVNG